MTVPEPSAEEMDQAVEAARIVTMGVVPRDVLAFALRAALPHLSAGVVAAAVKAEQERIADEILFDAQHATRVFTEMDPAPDAWHRGFVVGCESGKKRAAIIARGGTP